jgi:lipopolysaccharide transport system ATP-binding protein
VGRNGSGKSTLLQMIAGTLAPTTGDLQVNGRVSALLELGSGFDPEFSGRDNVFLNGAILGISQEEMARRFEDIVAFADIGDYIDQPVKTYSSGMYARLAFAVAINSDPDILIVDEALSVGDEAFQRKCFARIHEIKQRGATVLFVSHSASTVVEFCDSAILIDSGELLMSGTPKSVVSAYQKLIYAPAETRELIRSKIRSHESVPTIAEEHSAVPGRLPVEVETADFDPHLSSPVYMDYESQGAVIEDPRIEDLAGKRVNMLVHGEEYRYAYEVAFTKPSVSVLFGMLIKTISGFELGGGVTSSLANSIVFIDKGERRKVEFRFRCMLNPGTFFFNAGVMGMVGDTPTFLARRIDSLMFRVKPVVNLEATAIVDFHINSSVRVG